MNKVIILLLLFCHGNLGLAQVLNGLTIGANAGLGFPVGKFTNKQFGDQVTGFAKPGMAVTVSINYALKKIPFTILCDLRSLSFPFDSKRLTKSLTPGPYFTRNNYDVIGGYAGLSTPFVKGDKFSINSKLMFGVIRIGETILELRDNSRYQPLLSTNKSDPKTAFSFLLGADFEYKITGHWSSSIKIDFSSASMHVYNYELNSFASNRYRFEQHISSFVALAGISYRFNRQATVTFH
jgi:hypothetical protein